MKRFFAITLLCLIMGISISCGSKAPVGTWAQMDTGKPDDTFFELNFLNPQVGWLTGWDGQGPKETDGWEILQTQDGGKTWNPWPKQKENKIKQVYFVSDKMGWAINMDQDILNTTDGGETWAVQRKAGKVKVTYKYNNPGAPTEMPDPINRFLFWDENTGWAWGGGKKESSYEQDGVFLRTDDGGQTWQQVNYQFDGELKTVFFLDQKSGWASDRKGGIYKSPNGGRNWLKQPDDLRRPSINSIYFINEKTGWLAGADGYVGLTEDGGATWVKRKTGTTYLNDIHFINDKIGWVVGDDGVIMRSDDGGKTWYKHNSGTDLAIKHLQFLNDKLGWAAGNNGLLLRYEVQ